MKILPVGGLGEIGMNMMVVVWGDDAVILDAGLMFPDESMPGVDLVIPDVDSVLEREWRLLGVVVTHGHEDHIGALPFLLQKVSVPIYATSMTMGLIECKLQEFGLLDSAERYVITTDSPIDLGPFHIDFFHMCHSVVDGVGLALTTPAGVIIHSGDFKLDPDPIDGRRCDLEKIARYARKGVLLLFSDSTNVENEGISGSESSIRPAFERIFEKSLGRILISTFSSNIHRIQQVLDLAKKFGRKVVLVGRSMESNAKIATERGYLKVPEETLAGLSDLEYLPDDKVTVLSTGSQGEPMSTVSLMAHDRHKYLTIQRGDVLVLSSRFIPGNERSINQIINEFSRRGAHVEYVKISPVHVSGHAYRDELRSLIRLVRPKYFFPVHGEHRHLILHARLAEKEGIPGDRCMIARDGDLFEITEEGWSATDHIDVKRVYVDGKGVGDLDGEALRDRRLLSELGLVTVLLVVESSTGAVVSGPDISTRGVTSYELEAELVDAARASVDQRISELGPVTPEEWESTKDELRLAARRTVNRALGRKPLVQTTILYI